jgi:thymidylate kinase
MRAWSAAHASVVRSVIAELNGSGLEWMVLRNYEGLPDANRSKDLDLLCDRRHFPRLKSILCGVLRSHGFDRVAEQAFQYAWCCTFFATREREVLSIKFDLLDGFVWRGAQVVDFAGVYARRMPYGGFFVPDADADAFMLWVKPLLTGGFIKEKYRGDICRALTRSPGEFRRRLTATFGTRAARKVWPLLESGDIDGTVAHQGLLRRSAWLVAFVRNPRTTVSAAVEHVVREVRRRSRRPRASMFAVVGPDGSGKSTFIEELTKRLPGALVKEPGDVCVQHFRPNVFPNLKKLLGGSGYDARAERFTSPHRSRPAGRVSSLLRHAYYWLDYVIGYWLSIRRKCVAGKVYVFDRYCYDFIADPRRSRVDLPDWVRRLFLELTPEPDVVFFLDCDAETIYARKQELALPEIDRQLRAYRSLAGTSDRFVVLDARRDPEELGRAAVRHVVASFEALP